MRLYLAVLLSICFSMCAFAQGSGAGNGGIGVRCGNAAPKLIERLMLERAGQKRDPELKLGFVQYHQTIAARLSELSTSLGQIYLKRVLEYGSAKSWTSMGQVSAMVPLTTFDSYLDFELSANCKLAQLAVFEQGDSGPRQNHLFVRRLKLWDQRLLESHEVLYRYFSYELKKIDDPVLVRNLMVALQQKDWKSQAQKWLSRLSQNQLNRYSDEPQGVYIPLVGVDFERCASVMILESTGDGMQAAFLGLPRFSIPGPYSVRVRQNDLNQWKSSHLPAYFDRFEWIKDESVRFGGCTYFYSKPAHRHMVSGVLEFQAK